MNLDKTLRLLPQLSSSAIVANTTPGQTSYRIAEYEPDLWEVVYFGEINAEIRNQALSDWLSLVNKSKLKGVYVDFQQATLRMSTVDEYAFAERIAAAPILIQARHALLHRPEDVHLNRFVETVARNRGREVRIFSEKEEMLEWLRKARSPS